MVINGDTQPVPIDAIRVDRSTRWGNPFRIGPDGDRSLVLYKYARLLLYKIHSGEISLDELAALHGRTLVCHCKPKPCHGDLLACAAQFAHDTLRERG